MKVSVIIPTYKPKDYLWECLDSLVAQTLPPEDWELVMVLNGCCEPWNGEIRRYIAAKMGGMNVVFVQTDVPGVSNARNVALGHAGGEYVTFIDDDDYVSPDYLAELLRLAAPDVVSLSYPYAFVDGRPHEQLPWSFTDAYEHCARHGCGTMSSPVRRFYSGPCMKLIHRSIIGDRRYDTRFANGEDSIFMFLISDAVRHNVLAPRTAVYYRRYRTGSAETRTKGAAELTGIAAAKIREFTRIYFSRPSRYSFFFYLTRVLASLKGMVLDYSLTVRRRFSGKDEDFLV